jgi:hypothetical protein
MGKLSRRDALLQLAFAGTGAIAGVASPAVATAVSPRNRALDAMLQAAVNAGDAPGVVAMVATDRCACRNSNPAILMMQSAQHWPAKNVPGSFDGARYRRVLVQR